MQHNFIAFIKLANNQYLAEKTGESVRYVKHIKAKGFCKKVKNFYSLCELLRIKADEIPENYLEYVQEVIKHRGIVKSKLANNLELSNQTLFNLLTKESKSIMFFIRSCKIWTNVNHKEKRWYSD